MVDREHLVMDLLCGELQTSWSYCDQSCISCKFYHEESDMGARVSICVHGFGSRKESCGCYMTQNEYLEFVRSGFASLKAENAKLRESLEYANNEWEKESMEYLSTQAENAKLRDAMYTNAGKHALQHMDEDELRIWATQQSEYIDKLRELVGILCYCMQFGADCDRCKMNGENGKLTFDATYACDGLREMLRELGVEVGDVN